MRPTPFFSPQLKGFRRSCWPVCLLWLSCTVWGEDEIKEAEPLQAIEEIAPELVAGFFTDKAHRLIDAAMNRPSESQNCAACNTWVSSQLYAPQKTVGFSADVLYFQPVQDNLKYGETNTVTLSPPGQSVDQSFMYKLGFRGALHIPLYYDDWGMDVSYMYFYPTMPTTHKVDGNQFLFMTLAQTYFVQVNNALNIQCGEITGNWALKMDVLDIELKRSCWLGKSFFIEPILGLQASRVRQRLVVRYDNLYINNGANGPNGPLLNPQKIVSTSEVWGLGPEVGANMRFLLPQGFNLFFRAAFSSMFGQFKTTTKYSEFIATSGGITAIPPSALISVPVSNISTLKETIARSFSMMQIQASFAKLWKFGKTGSVELVLGWETQFWWSQNRMNWFSTVALPSEGADLSLQGPFGRVDVQF
ncbi:MAG: hypothetical protein IT584_00090 [Chlamydiae bacterium]|nr:hypothetical protein [Chlamydiota bacterium]